MDVVPIVEVDADVDMVPNVDGVPIVDVIVETGADGFCVRPTAGGLSPPVPSSLAPIGIPTRPTGDGVTPIPVGDDVEAAAPAKEVVVVVVVHVPDAVPVMPPPSNDVAEGGLVAVEDPLPDDTPVIDVLPDDIPTIEVPAPDDIPADELPAPDDVPVAEVPNEACGSEPPIPPQLDATFVPGVNGDTPFVAGLTPSLVISVAPKGMRVGGTGEAGPMPSGDAMLRGGSGAPVCAKADPQLSRTVAVVTITRRVIMDSTPSCVRAHQALNTPAHAGRASRALL